MAKRSTISGAIVEFSRAITFLPLRVRNPSIAKYMGQYLELWDIYDVTSLAETALENGELFERGPFNFN